MPLRPIVTHWTLFREMADSLAYTTLDFDLSMVAFKM